jgi:hypothetical protein
MPDRMKRQEIWDWAIEAYDPPGVLTAFQDATCGRTIEGNPPVVHPDVWKALQEMDEEIEKASGATDFNVEFVTEMTIAEAKAKWPNFGDQSWV